MNILKETIHPFPNIYYSIGPHSPYLYDDESLRAIGDACHHYGVQMHIHVQETEDELRNSVLGNHEGRNCHKSDAKCSPIANLARLGVLDDTCCAHCVHLLESDFDELAKHPISS